MRRLRRREHTGPIWHTWLSLPTNRRREHRIGTEPCAASRPGDNVVDGRHGEAVVVVDYGASAVLAEAAGALDQLGQDGAGVFARFFPQLSTTKGCSTR
jgi:hypothetical protein